MGQFILVNGLKPFVMGIILIFHFFRKGVITWPDGSKFEGMFRNNKANGRGRLLHANGEVYEGNWIDDKTNG